MKIITIDLKTDYSGAVSLVVEALRRGGSAIFPTDTVYGVGANACDYHVAKQIFRIKDRPQERALPVLVRNMAWAREVAFIPPKLEPVLERIWPGPVTAVFPKRKVIPSSVTAGRDTVGIRISDSPVVDKILGGFGYPLATTSANISGSDEGSNDPEIIIKAFEKHLFKPDIMLDAGVLPVSKPSTVIDFTTIQPRILRVGVTKPDELMEILGVEIK